MASAPAPSVEPAAPAWRRNPGYQPTETVGKRVRVILGHAREASYDNNPMSPPGWAADTTRWTITGSDYDVARYMLL